MQQLRGERARRAANRRWTIIGLVVLGMLGLTPVVASLSGGAAAAATAVAGDGTTSTTAGASCWGIKTAFPAATDGVYWLSSSSMDRPAEFYCDMSTDGGGWVLIGRGRDGWTFNPNGQGSAATVRNAVDGPAAFAPAALDTATIVGLLGGAPLVDNTDGIRLRRSTNSTGTTRQEIRLLGSARDWTWNLPAGQLLKSVRINGTAYNGSNTKDTAGSTQGQTTNQLSGVNDSRRIFTTAVANKNNRQGFGTGAVSGGSNAAGNFLWTAGTEGNPLAFTQVFLRPRIANAAAGFTPLPATGLPEERKPLALKNRSELAPWGVVGLNHTNEQDADPWYTTVMAIEIVGDRVFVGGRFNGVQKGPNAPVTSQPFMAAFDLQGNWISSFTPQFDGRVWDIKHTENGKLIVGGDFTQVNGQPRTGLVALDPTTGATDPSWNASVQRDGSRAMVRSIETRGDTVWVSGRFNRASGGATANATVSNAVSFNTGNGAVGTWKPRIHAQAMDLTLTNDGTRMLMVGYFAAVNDDTNMGYMGITDATTGAVIPGYGPLVTSSTTAKYQQAVVQAPSGNLVVGGSQHSLAMYTPNRSTVLNSHITRNGGDYQFAAVHDGFIYSGCHCINWDYQGTMIWPNVTGYRSVDPIRFIARYDAETLEQDTTWYPNGTKGANDGGPWAFATDKNNCVWMGGDFVRGAYSGNSATDYLGGLRSVLCDRQHPADRPDQPPGDHRHRQRQPHLERVERRWRLGVLRRVPGRSGDRLGLRHDLRG